MTDSLEELDDAEIEHATLMKQTHDMFASRKNSSSSTSSVRSKYARSYSSPKSTRSVTSQRLSECEQWVNNTNTSPPAENEQLEPVSQEMKVPEGDKMNTCITDSLIEQFRMNRLPPPEPIVFSGNPMQYTNWKQAYEILIELRGRSVPPAERFFYLRKYLKGEALELVEGFSLVNDETSYGGEEST